MINKVVSRLVLYSFINNFFISSSLTSFLPSFLCPCHIFISPIAQPQYHSHYSNCTTRCMIPVLKTGPVNRCYSTPKTSRPALRPPTFLFNRFQSSFLALSGPDTKWTAHRYLVLRLRMSGAVPHTATICLHVVGSDTF